MLVRPWRWRCERKEATEEDPRHDWCWWTDRIHLEISAKVHLFIAFLDDSSKPKTNNSPALHKSLIKIELQYNKHQPRPFSEMKQSTAPT